MLEIWRMDLFRIQVQFQKDTQKPSLISAGTTKPLHYSCVMPRPHYSSVCTDDSGNKKVFFSHVFSVPMQWTVHFLKVNTKVPSAPPRQAGTPHPAHHCIPHTPWPEQQTRRCCEHLDQVWRLMGLLLLIYPLQSINTFIKRRRCYYEDSEVERLQKNSVINDDSEVERHTFPACIWLM